MVRINLERGILIFHFVLGVDPSMINFVILGLAPLLGIVAVRGQYRKGSGAKHRKKRK